MNARVSSTALKENVVAVLSPRFIESSADDRTPIPLPLIIRVCHHVLYERMLTTAPQKIGDRH
jgi:hypothetical protein